MVLMHGRTASCCIGYDRVDVLRESLKITACERLRGAQIAGVPGQSAATALVGWSKDFNPITCQPFDRRCVDVRVETSLCAAGQHRYPRLAPAKCRRHRRPVLSQRKLFRHEINHWSKRTRRE